MDDNPDSTREETSATQPSEQASTQGLWEKNEMKSEFHFTFY